MSAPNPAPASAPAPAPRYRRSFVGPLLLILVGVLFLLRNMGYPLPLFELFARYWPLLIILWGVSKLIDYYQAQREGYTPRGIGAGGTFFLIILVLCGLTASAAWKYGDRWRDMRGDIEFGDEFPEIFGRRYEFTDAIQQPFPANGQLKVAYDRGDIKVVPGEPDVLHVNVKKVVYASSQSEADKNRDILTPKITVNGDVVTIETNQGWSGPDRLDLEISLPAKAPVDLMTLRGDIEVISREAPVKVKTNRGDITLTEIKGNAEAEFRRGDLRAERITGNLSVEGRGSEVQASDIGGTFTLRGEFSGPLTFARIAKTARFKSSRTDFEVAKIDGEITFDSGDLRGHGVAGPSRILTRSYDVHLDDLAGDLTLENRNGEVGVHIARLPVGNISIDNSKEPIQIWLPRGATFRLDASADRGDIDTDFRELVVSRQDRSSRAAGSVGSGGGHIRLNADRGSIEIRHGGESSGANPGGSPGHAPEGKDEN
ncbi:MAG TPA: DUF4097 family beta strand repeat-containing protein [Terriglobales bacterium]|nr:DUF4097 family beta strand repeat-containing protein [Terriglobales bacterium]